MTRRSMIVAGAAPLAFAAEAKPRHGRPAPLPPAYTAIARRMGIPPLVLYGVALQESKMLFGASALPYPWTLCVRGQGRRFPSYEAAVAGLRQAVDHGITNVDCGSMQVNWHWHKSRLRSVWNALDAYPNIAIGAQILRERFEQSRDWFAAVGAYHHPSDRQRAMRYAQSVFDRLPKIPRTEASTAGVIGRDDGAVQRRIQHG